MKLMVKHVLNKNKKKLIKDDQKLSGYRIYTFKDKVIYDHWYT